MTVSGHERPVHTQRARVAYAVTLIVATLSGLTVVTALPAVAAVAPTKPVTSLHVVSRTASAVKLSWVNPASKTFSRAVVRYARGLKAPSSPTAGHRGGTVHRPSHSITVIGLSPSTRYAFAVFAINSAGKSAKAATIVARTRPAAVRSLAVTGVTSSSASLSWVNPTVLTFAGVMVRDAVGTVSPSSPTSGHLVGRFARTRHTLTVSGLTPSTKYSFAVFAIDTSGLFAAGQNAHATTAVPPPPPVIKPLAGSYSANQVVNNSPLTFYVSTDSSHLQDVTIFNTLACAPNGKTFNDTFTLSTATINPDGSFSASQAHDGVLRIATASFPAHYTYTFTGNFHGLNSGAVERAAGTWQETVTYNDGTAQTCTTTPLPWTISRDAQGSQAAAPAPAGSYSANQVVNNSPLTFYVSTDNSHAQDVTIFNTLACAPNGKTFNDTFTLSPATINPDGSFSATQAHDGVLRIATASFPATYSYTFTGNFHGLSSGAVQRAAGTWQETVTYNDGTAQTCTTNPLPWTLSRDAQGSQVDAPAPAGSYSAGQLVNNSPLTFYVSTDNSHVQDVTIFNALACVPNGKTFNDTF